MVRIREAIIVEGRYDKNTLSQIVDAPILETSGFGIFKDKEKCELIKTFAKKDGVIVLTDSDSAGNLIRAHIKNIVGDSKITNVFFTYITCSLSN